MHFLFAVAGCLTLAPVAQAQTHGTAVIILATRDSIVVAADSKVTASAVNGKASAVTIGPGSRALHPCKILKVDDSTFVAIQGYRSTAETTMTDARGGARQSRGSHPDFLKEVRDAMRNEPGSMAERFSKALQPLADYRFSEETVQEARNGKSSGPVVLIQLVCFGRDAGQLTLLQWRKSDTSVEGPWTIELPPRQMQLGILGSVQEKLSPFIQAHPEMARGKGFVAQARSLMHEAFKLDSSNVGPPVDILRIDRTGYIWIQRKEGCE